MSNSLLKALAYLQKEQKLISYEKLIELLKIDNSISFFINLSCSTVRIYSSRFNCHTYNVAFKEEDNDCLIIEKIIKL